MVTAADNSAPAALPPELELAHRSHAAELRRIIMDLPIAAGHRILDVGCGDGAYAALLAQRAGPSGSVVGVDASPGCLKIASDRLANCGESKIALINATIEALPFPEQSFDFIWCAKSLVSFPQPEFAIHQMARMLRPCGVLAIMENDSLHEVALPWPEELELAIRQAELDAYRAQVRRPDKRYIARRLQTLLCDAGLNHIRRKTYTIDRTAPLRPTECEYLIQYLSGLRDKVFPYLDRYHRLQFDELASPESPEFLPRMHSFGMTWFEVVCSGQSSSSNRFRPIS